MRRSILLLFVPLLLSTCEKSTDPIVVNIQHPEPEEPVDTTSTDDTTSAVLADYFPLSVGNQWSYSFHNFYRSPGGQVIDTVRGTTQWKIISSSTMNQDSSFLVEETVNGIWIHTYNYTYSSGVDTNYFVSTKFHFNIIEAASHRILVQYVQDSLSSPNNYLPSVLQSRVLYRYGDPALLGSIITFGPYDALLTVEVRKGLTFFGFHQIGNSQTVYAADLTSYSVH